MDNLYLFGVSTTNQQKIIQFTPITCQLVNCVIPEGLVILNYMQALFQN